MFRELQKKLVITDDHLAAIGITSAVGITVDAGRRGEGEGSWMESAETTHGGFTLHIGPKTDKHDLPEYDFPELFSEFMFSSFYTKVEVSEIYPQVCIVYG